MHNARIVRPFSANGEPALLLTTQERICNALRLGATRQAAAQAGGVSPGTVVAWLKRGRNGEQPYQDFRQSYVEAEYYSRESLLAKMATHYDSSWQSVAWMLERRFPDEYGKKQEVKLSGSIDLKNTSKEDLDKREAALLARLEKLR